MERFKVALNVITVRMVLIFWSFQQQNAESFSQLDDAVAVWLSHKKVISSQKKGKQS